MLKTFKYRIRPTRVQEKMLDHHFGCCRLVWNLALAAKKGAYETSKINVTRYELQNQLLDLKQTYDWLYEVNSQSLQSVLLNLDNAYKMFFMGRGYPKFKSKRSAQSFRCPQFVKIVDGKIKLPIIGKIAYERSNNFKGDIKTVTISKTPTGKYFASILVETAAPIPAKPQVMPGTTVGIDVGIKSFVVTSNGKFFEPNRKLKESLARLQYLQRRASRKKKGSNNRKKANLCVAKLHEKITNQRIDYCHKITTGLIRDNQAETFVVEDLAVVNMLKNRKLSRAISDVSFGEFFRQMKYKCEWYGKNLIVIDRFAPSSKRCSSCGEINDSLTLADREWTCKCGAIHERDLNAAKNIKYFGLEKYSGRGTTGEPVESRRLRRTKKREL